MTNPPTPDEVAAREIFHDFTRHTFASALPWEAVKEVMLPKIAGALQFARLDERRRCAERVTEAFTDPTGTRGVWFRMESEIIRAINAPTDQSGGGG